MLPGDPPVTKTLTQTGAYTFICKVHSFYDATTDDVDRHGRHGHGGGRLRRASEPSGVDFTEYRVKTGDARVTGSRPTTPAREPVRVAGQGRGRGPAHGRVPLDRQGRQRRDGQVGRVHHPGEDGHAGPETVTPTPTPNTPAATPTPAPPVPTATPAPKPKPSVQAGQAQQDDGRQVRQERAEAPCHVHGGDERLGDGDGHEQGRARPSSSSRPRWPRPRSSAEAGSTSDDAQADQGDEAALAKAKESVKVTVTVTVKPAGQSAIKATRTVTLTRK